VRLGKDGTLEDVVATNDKPISGQAQYCSA
jgi:hypothetical protein